MEDDRNDRLYVDNCITRVLELSSHALSLLSTTADELFDLGFRLEVNRMPGTSNKSYKGWLSRVLRRSLAIPQRP
jgi:hypothetical protein